MERSLPLGNEGQPLKKQRNGDIERKISKDMQIRRVCMYGEARVCVCMERREMSVCMERREMSVCMERREMSVCMERREMSVYGEEGDECV